MVDWLHISQLSGSGDTIITITADTMESLVRRTTELVVSGNTKFVTVPVEQVPHDYSEDYLTFKILTSGKIYWQRLRSRSTSTTIQYRINGGEWTSISSTLSGTSSNFAVQAGDVVEFKGNNSTYSRTGSDIDGGFRCSNNDSATFNVQGNIMSLVYGDNFQNQTTLTESNTFYELFYGGNSALGPVDASNLVLPATTLSNGCYKAMFDGTRALVTPPKELPATVVAENAYYGMFRVCVAMTTAPVISAVTLSSASCRSMFSECYSLTAAPEIQATTLGDYCCFSMFESCTAMTTAPSILPATTLANTCYDYMFAGCTSITTAPVLPAPTLASNSYSYMFNGCTSLNRIECYARNPGTANTYNWVQNVAPTGTFVKYLNANWTIGDHGIPTGWVVEEDYHGDTAVFNITGSGDLVWKWVNVSGGTAYPIYVKKNNDNWTTLQATTSGSTLSVSAGDTLKVKGIANSYTYTDPSYYVRIYSYHTFGDSTCQFTLSGNIMGMLNSDTFASGYNYHFYRLFANCTGLTSIAGLEMPATTLGRRCYVEMFTNCTSLTTVATNLLPATSVPEMCYNQMFAGCTSLTNTPSLPATTVAFAAYSSMFARCTSLTTAPALPATNLSGGSEYSSMFDGCTSLTTAPALPATTVGLQSYIHMFRDTAITTAPALPATTMAQQCYSGMFIRTPITTAPALPATSLAVGCYMQMFKECTNLTTAPALPATTLQPSCYEGMFWGCTSLTTAPDLLAPTLVELCYGAMFYQASNLSSVKCTATSLNSDTWSTQAWLDGVSSSGTFYKASSVQWSSGPDGIPANWTVVAV